MYVSLLFVPSGRIPAAAARWQSKAIHFFAFVHGLRITVERVTFGETPYPSPICPRYTDLQIRTAPLVGLAYLGRRMDTTPHGRPPLCLLGGPGGQQQLSSSFVCAALLTSSGLGISVLPLVV